MAGMKMIHGALAACALLGGCGTGGLTDVIIIDLADTPMSNPPALDVRFHDRQETVEGESEYLLQWLPDPSTLEAWAQVPSGTSDGEDEVRDGFPTATTWRGPSRATPLAEQPLHASGVCKARSGPIRPDARVPRAAGAAEDVVTARFCGRDEKSVAGRSQRRAYPCRRSAVPNGRHPGGER